MKDKKTEPEKAPEDKAPNEVPVISTDECIKIFDPETEEVFLEQRL
jgi:hypothetical protein